MKTFKKLLALVLVLGCVIGCMAGCNNTNVDPSESTGASETGSETVDKPLSEKTYAEMNAIEFTEVMGNGINLGNTMEAYGHQSQGTNKAPSVYETLWGMPVTTKEMLQGMKDAGFDSLRIPVAWTNTMKYENGDYTIDQRYLDRVKEIIEWAIEVDMIVVVNDHWDGGWWAMFGSDDEALRTKAMELYTSMWTQIAENYKDIDHHLVFESANEEMGNRFNDEWNRKAGVLTKDECYALTNQLNQKFVDIIRSTGGSYNNDRFLLCAGYNTNIADTCDDRYVMPTDKVDGKLIVSVHYYDPSGYTIDSGISNWGKKSEVEYMNATLQKLTKFTDAGYGVIIGEYGVLIEGKSELKSDTITYLKNFLANCDLYGYCPMLWDCNSQYDRNQCKMVFNDVAKLYYNNGYYTTQTLPEYIIPQAERTLKNILNAAPEGEKIPDTEARAWLMFASGDYSVTYRVGDAYPEGETSGIKATEAKITGTGTYTVGLDFTGTGAGKATDITFSAIGITNAEKLYPGYCIEIKEIKVNGQAIELIGKPYTTADDAITTRVNIVNDWVTKIPDDARVADGNLTGVVPTPINKATGAMQTIEITFEFVAP